MIWLYITLGVIGLILILVFVTLFFIYKGVYYTPIKGQDNEFLLTEATLKYAKREDINQMIQTMLDIPYEDIYTKSFDRLKLHARLYRNKDSNVVCIMCHGYRGTPCRDFSGFAKDMIKKGYNVILIDERGHGKSEGHSITFGNREKKDLLSWIEYSKKEFGEKIRFVFCGLSMGGATVLLASDHYPKGSKVIADCPYAAPREIVTQTIINNLGKNPKVLYPIANLTSIIFCHENLNKEDANRNVKKSEAKFLIIHGDIDSVVPYKLSERVYLENKDKVRYELIKGAEHGISYIIDTPRYKRVVDEFLDN